jgi:hypothetical protein
MARRKTIITQRDFSAGSPRPEAAERDDSALVAEGVREAENTITLTTGGIEARPGTYYVGTTAADQGVEIDLGRGRVYDLHVIPNGVKLYNADGSEAASFTSTTWDSLSGKYGTATFSDVQFWVVPDPDTSSILIGAYPYPAHALTVDAAGTWSFGELSYASSAAGATLQPFWNYHPGVTITPSALTGTITVTASSPIFSAAWAGLTIRYGGKQIDLTTFSSTTVMNATVVEVLAPTRTITVADAAGFQVGDAVENSTGGGQGVITGISGTDITVLATALYYGFPASGNLVGPNAASAVSAVTSASPAASALWDVQMGNPVHGYAGWAAKHKGRVYLTRYPGAPNAFAVSTAGAVDDFTDGVEDADGFVETIGTDKGGDLLYIISAEDLLFFTTKGLYYQQTRDQRDVTPTTIGPVQFSSIGAADVVPVAVDDGAVFIDSVGRQVYGAVLSGDIYRSWRAQHISQFHGHLFTSPVFLGATQFGSDRPEHFIFVVNSDGTAATGQWQREANKIGWRKWTTDGTFKSIYQAFGAIHAVVNRDRSGFTGQFREVFVDGLVMDCVAHLAVDSGNRYGKTVQARKGKSTKFAPHLYDLTVTVYFEGWDLGDRSLNATGEVLNEDGSKLEYPDYEGVAQVGLPFTVKVTPWDRRVAEYQRSTRDIKRMTHLFITVQDTLGYTFGGERFGGYRVGEPTNIPPALRSEEVKFVVARGDAYMTRTIELDRPGPFRLTKLRYRVVV